LVDSAPGLPPPLLLGGGGEAASGGRRLDSGEATPSPSSEFKTTAEKVGFGFPIASLIPLLFFPLK